MVEPLAPRYDVLPREPLIQPPAPTGLYQPPPSEELRAKFRLGWLPQAIVRGRAADIPPDPSYHVWGDIAGYEQYAGALGSSRSKAETDALKAMIDRNRQDQLTASTGQLGLLGDLMAGVFDPVNLIPVPAVKGIGLVRGALRMGAATGALATATEVARISSDPTAEWSQMPGNIALATLLGGAIGAPVGAWGARAARRERAIRAFEADLGSLDSPQHALRPRGADEGTVYDYQRPPRNADGSYSRFKTVEEVRGYKPQTVDGVRYVSEDGVTWTTAADEGRAGPLSVSDDIAEQLGTPEPNLVRVQYVDEVAIKAEHAANGWHDELQSYVDGPTDIRRIVLDANDFVVFRHKQHQWEETLRPLDGETPQAFKERAGKEAMLEFRASKQTGDYAGFIGKVLGRLNFSPLAKLIRMVNGDNFVADLGMRTSGDYAWAIEGNRTRWSTPPSLLLKALRHTPRYKQFQDEFEAEWVKYASGNQSYGGRTFQGLNVSAAAYSLKRGFRRGGGANGMSHADFEEMVAEAIFTRGDFEVRGFPVNENARNAAKAFTRLAQEYDDLLRAAGAFRDQKNLTRDIAYWTKQRIYYQNRVMQWLWGETGQPANLLHAIRVNDRVFTGASHDEAVQNMVDALGDEGVALSEKLTPDSYGYTYREPTAPPLAELPTPRDPLLLAESDVPAVGEPAATVGRPSPEVTARIVPGEGPPPSAPPVQYDQFGNPVEMPPPPDLAAIEDPTGMAYDPAFEGFTTVGQALQHVIDSPYSPELKVVAERIMSFTRDVRMKVVHSLEPGERPDVEVPGDLYGRMLNEIMGLYSPGEIGGRVFVRGLGFGRRAAGASTVVHEALHSAAWDRVNQGLKEGASTPLGIAVGKLEDLRKTVTRHYMAEPGLLPDALREYQISNVHELISYGLSDRKFQDWLKSIRLDNGETGFTAFVKRIAALFGFGDDAQNALARVMQLADEVLPEANAPSVLQQQLDRNRARREALYPSLYRKKAEGPAAIEPTDQPAFISSEEQPTRLQGQSPAVRYKDEILYGYEHIDAVKAFVDKYGAQFEKDWQSDDLDVIQFGWGFKPEGVLEVNLQPKAMEGPAAIEPTPSDGVGEGFTRSKDAPALLGNQPDRMPAVMYGGRVFTGGDHATAIEAARARFGDEIDTVLEENPEEYLGYWRPESERPQPKAMEGPPSRKKPSRQPGVVTAEPRKSVRFVPAREGVDTPGSENWRAAIRWGDKVYTGSNMDDVLAEVVRLFPDAETKIGANPSLYQGYIEPGTPKVAAAPDPDARFVSHAEADMMPAEARTELVPAVTYKGEIFTSNEHIHAVEDVISAHPEFEQVLDQADDANEFIGYARREQPKAMKGPAAIEPTPEAQPQFVSVDDAMDQRVRRLTPKQRAIYDERAAALADADGHLARSRDDLKSVTEMPHQFLDANGRPEPWYHRSWDKAKGATEREQLTRLITRWFERDNPDGARQRAVQAVDNILKEPEDIAGTSVGMSSLNRRTLNMPNSWAIEDPDFGTIKVSDFIDKRVLSIAEHMVKRSGMIVETARMFGDASMSRAMTEMKDYLLATRWEKASPADRPGVKQHIDEVMGQFDIVRRSVTNTLRMADPLRVDNRLARFMRDFATLGMMGKVAFASVAEILRPAMVSGFGVQFNVILAKYLGDLEKIRPNLDLIELMGETFDLGMQMNHVQAVTIQDGEPVMGGTWVEKLIHDQVPNLYKISGLTSLTTWQKTIMGLCAQHSVMDEAIKVGGAIAAGRIPDQAMMLRLNAMGISARDAVLLSRMPVERYRDGRLILPVMDRWESAGVSVSDARRAREALLNGVHAEIRRAIVTPSVGDRSTVFNGIWTSGGKVVAETDLMTLPMQFLSYGMGAHNRLLISSLQGRDRMLVMGMFNLLLMGIGATWIKTDEKVWKAKTYDQIIADGFDNSGIGGFWFSNLNTQIERVSSGQLGLRPALGIKSGFEKQEGLKGPASALGAAPGYFYDLSRAFWDTGISASERAQIIRKGIPYNNVVWWERIFREMAGEIGSTIEGKKQ